MAPGQVVRVAFVGGCMRSGSTLVERMLGRVPGVVAVGEVVHLWERGVKGNELCGCGLPFHRCPFWLRVGTEAFGGWDRLDVDEVIRLQHSVDRTRYIPLMLDPRTWPPYAGRLKRYGNLLARLYRAIDQVADGAVIVDSSKHASTAYLLRRVPDVQMHVIHLVRDSHGVAFSLTKRIRRPEVVGGRAYMPRTTPVRSGVEWLAFNGLFHVLRRTGVPMTLLRYESVVSQPSAQISRVLSRLGMSVGPAGLRFIDDHVVDLGVDHTVAGNPMRFRHGDLRLKLDDDWQRHMRTVDRGITSAITWPLLARYGYLSRRQD